MSTRTTAERTRDEQRVEQALLGNLLPKHDPTSRIHTKVVGVTKHNADGSSRQEAIDHMTQFDLVELRRNPNDKWDENAVQVIATIENRRVQIGHLDADLASTVAPCMDRGEHWCAIATRVGGKISLGVSLMLFRRV